MELKKNDNQNVDVKGKQILVDVDNGTIAERKSNDVESHVPVVSRMSDQERLDEMYVLFFLSIILTFFFLSDIQLFSLGDLLLN